MFELRKSTAAAIMGLGAIALFSVPAFAASDQRDAMTGAPIQLAHMSQGQSGQSERGPCPMGMTAPGKGSQGMMGGGMHGQGMMGQGMMGSALSGPVVAMKHLSVEDVRHFLEHRLEMHGNKRLKVGEVTEANDKIVADITTVDGSLVQRLEVDRHSGTIELVE